MAAEPSAPRAAGRSVRLLGVLAAVGFVALLVYGVTARAPDTSIDDALAGKRAIQAPGFELAVLTDGRAGRLAPVWRRAATDGKVSLSELQGTPIVVNFWASWCDPCRQEAPVLERGWQAARSHGVLLVGLNMQDVREDARAFLDEFRQDYPTLRDPSNKSARRWGATGIPETFFINRQGDVVGHVIGTVTARQLDEGVQAALDGRPRGADRGGDQRPTR